MELLESGESFDSHINKTVEDIESKPVQQRSADEQALLSSEQAWNSREVPAAQPEAVVAVDKAVINNAELASAVPPSPEVVAHAEAVADNQTSLPTPPPAA
jgi:hypothetical protein